MTMLVCTLDKSIFHLGIGDRFAKHARVQMVFGQTLYHGGECHNAGGGQNACLPHGAAQHAPGRRAWKMKSRVPTTSDPTGAPNPFERQNCIESACWASVATAIP